MLRHSHGIACHAISCRIAIPFMGEAFRERVHGMGSAEVLTAPQSTQWAPTMEKPLALELLPQLVGTAHNRKSRGRKRCSESRAVSPTFSLSHELELNYAIEESNREAKAWVPRNRALSRGRSIRCILSRLAVVIPNGRAIERPWRVAPSKLWSPPRYLGVHRPSFTC